MAHIKQLIARLAIVYLLFALCRLFFYIYNIESFELLEAQEFIFIFIYALRFDTSAIFYGNLLVILLHLLPFKSRETSWYQKMLKGVFFFSNGLVLLLEVADIGYFQYAFRRILRSDFEMSSDVQNLLPQFLSEFWFLVLFYFLLLTTAYYLYKKTELIVQQEYHFSKQILLLIPTLGLFFIGLRGGVQSRPLMPIVASQYVSNAQLMPLVSNTTLGVIHSFQQRTLEKKNYFDEATLEKLYTTTRFVTKDSFQKKNIVILICESMGREYIGYFNKDTESHTPFLDSILDLGLNFVNTYANGTRSTQGIVAIVGGIPSLMADPFMFSAYQNNQITGLGTILNKYGYTNAFFHGGENGTMGFSQFVPITGVQKYYGRTEYISANGDKDYDGNWGIWDIPFYDYTLKEINQFSQPFFATLFSINVHHPFNTEASFAAKYPNLDKRLVAIKYADYNLRLFFEKAQQQPWFKNTLFVITADHTGPDRSEKYIHSEGCYRIPLLFYAPGDSLLVGKRTEVTQQIDIQPSILGYLGYPEPFFAFGNNKFDSSNQFHVSFTFKEDVYQLIEGNYVLQFDGNESIGLYNRIDDVYLNDNLINKFPGIAAQMEEKLKAIIQTHHQKMIDNKLYWENKI